MPGSPLFSITRRDLSRFVRLSPRRRWAVVRAAVWLPAVDLALRTVGFSVVRRWLRRLASPRKGRAGYSAGASSEAERVETLAWAVAAASAHHLYPMRCLPRSLVLQTLLAREGIPAELRIGVRREDGRLEAHAWVEHEGRPLAERDDPLGTFSALGLPPR